MNSYDRQPKESTKAYQAFTRYRDQGSDRSLEKVASELGVSLSLIKRWSSQHEWVKRVEDYDLDLELLDQETLRAERKEFARRERERQLALWEKLNSKVEELLAWPIKRTKQILPGVDGKPTEVIIEPAKWNFGTVASLMNVWLELGEQIAGNDRDVPQALKVLVDNGWIPASILDEASIGMDELGNRIRSAFADLKQPIDSSPNCNSAQNSNQDFGY